MMRYRSPSRSCSAYSRNWATCSGDQTRAGSRVSGGTVGTAAFRLPEGFRPPADFVTAAISSGSNPPGLCRLQINADGTVVPQNAVPSFVAIDTAFDPDE